MVVPKHHNNKVFMRVFVTCMKNNVVKNSIHLSSYLPVPYYYAYEQNNLSNFLSNYHYRGSWRQSHKIERNLNFDKPLSQAYLLAVA